MLCPSTSTLYLHTLCSYIFFCSQGFALTPTSSGQLQFPLINMSQLKALNLDKNVKLEPIDSGKDDNSTATAVLGTHAVTIPQVSQEYSCP